MSICKFIRNPIKKISLKRILSLVIINKYYRDNIAPRQKWPWGPIIWNKNNFNDKILEIRIGSSIYIQFVYDYALYALVL